MLLRFRWLRRLADAHGQRDGPGIGRPDAALGQWPRPADLAGAAAAVSRGGLTGHVHRGQPGTAPVGSAVHRGFHGIDKRSQRVEHRLVTALGATEFDQRVMSGAQRLGHVDVSRSTVITQPASGCGQRRAPEHPRCAAGLGGPGLARGDQDGFRSAAALRSRGRSGTGRRGTTDHAATVIAVASHGVDAAEFGFRVGHPGGDRHQRVGNMRSAHPGGFIGLDERGCGPEGLRGCMAALAQCV